MACIRVRATAKRCMRENRLSARIVALGVGVLALAALRMQFDALLEPVASGPVWAKIWVMAAYFTILTNGLVAVAMFAAAQGRALSGRVAGGVLLSILMVGIIYYVILARLWDPQGLAYWADQGLHTAVPLATLGWWLAFAPKDARLRDLPFWLIWPLVYCLYSLIRGAMTGFWPYPFIDLPALGPLRLSLNIAGLVVAFGLLGLVIVGLGRGMRRSA